jgi:hypothetical protein
MTSYKQMAQRDKEKDMFLFLAIAYDITDRKNDRIKEYNQYACTFNQMAFCRETCLNPPQKSRRIKGLISKIQNPKRLKRYAQTIESPLHHVCLAIDRGRKRREQSTQ